MQSGANAQFISVLKYCFLNVQSMVFLVFKIEICFYTRVKRQI